VRDGFGRTADRTRLGGGLSSTVFCSWGGVLRVGASSTIVRGIATAEPVSQEGESPGL
jgi:hypothetical protein